MLKPPDPCHLDTLRYAEVTIWPFTQFSGHSPFTQFSGHSHGGACTGELGARPPHLAPNPPPWHVVAPLQNEPTTPPPGPTMTNTPHQPVVAADLPKPIGPYSPGVTLDRLVIVSGQGATDPATGKLAGPDVEAQTRQVFKNMAAILEAAGSDLQHVLRCGVFLVDLRDFEKMNAVYAEVFGEHRPARTTVQVSSLPDPGLRVEIDCIAYKR